MSKYGYYFDIDEEFFSAVNQELIEEGKVDWHKFFPHETFVKLIKDTVSVLTKQHLSIWVEGGYGTGKSYAALTLKKLLEASEDETRAYFQPAAREAVYRSLYGEEKILSLANASLAVEYLLAMKKIGASFLPFPVLRVGPEEWENTEKEGILSATALREKLYRGESIASWVPSAVSEELAEEIRAGRAPVSLERYFGTLIYLLRCEDRSTASEYYGLSSVFDRLRDFSYGSKSLADLIVRAGNQNVTDSRLRRSLLALLCRIPRYAEKEIPAYTRVLAVGEKGREILFQMKELQGIPVVTKPAHLFKISDRNAMKWAALEMKAEEIYSMAFEKETEKGYFLRKTPYLLPSLSKKDDPA